MRADETADGIARATALRPLHLALALFLIAIWGFNFVVTKEGLAEIPPITLSVLRFVFSAFPAVLFIPRPAVSWRMLLVFGLLMFAFQFACLYGGMAAGLSAGLASIALQLHVFVTIGLAAAMLGERPTPWQIAGAALALVGMVVVGLHVGGDVTLIGLALVIGAAVFWGAANVVSKTLGRVDMVGLVVWGSLVAPLPLLALALLIEGPARMLHSLAAISWLGAGAVVYIVGPVTLFGFSLWSWLLDRYTAASVVPLTLLVPIVAMGSSVLVLGEPLQGWKIAAGALVCSGLGVGMLGARLGALIARR